MHDSSMRLMQGLLDRPCFADVKTVLDCGSAIAVPGHPCYRPMCEAKGWEYTGFDATDSPNVDVVGDIYNLEESLDAKIRDFDRWILDGFDLVINGQMLEHLDFPLLAVQNMKDVLRTDGWLVCIAPFGFGEHRYPIDCWRFLPDGMRFLMEGLEDIEAAFYGELDCYSVGRKPKDYKEPWKISRSR